MAPVDGPPSSSKRPREGGAHGSFRRYYADRGLASWAGVDPRLRALRADLFNGRRCLDIGCHEGAVAIWLARRWHCASMVGVDIDEKLVRRATRRLERYVPAGTDTLAECSPLTQAPSQAASPPEAPASDIPPAVAETRALPVSLLLSMGFAVHQRLLQVPATPFPRNTSFRVLDVAQPGSTNVFADGSLDTVVCLSTSKWVHLNGGDAAITRLFDEVHRMLVDGGAFVLEPQPWASYRRKQHASEQAEKHYKQIKLKPEHFPAYLRDCTGFRTCEQVRVEYDLSVSKGFAVRPLYVLIK